MRSIYLLWKARDLESDLLGVYSSGKRLLSAAEIIPGELFYEVWNVNGVCRHRFPVNRGGK